MNKLDLRLTVGIAWFKATGKNDGWNVFLSMYDSKVSQSSVAKAFDVDRSTVNRWYRRYEEELAKK